MGVFYFAIGDGFIVITPCTLWDRRKVWSDQGTAANIAIERLGLPLYEMTESCYETALDDDDARALLVQHGATENPDLLVLQ